jgi:hypothetical protein
MPSSRRQTHAPHPLPFISPCRHKFCVAFEDDTSQDYVTELLWQALAAGCVPIYYGSRSILQYVPDPRSVIVYDPGGKGNASTPQQLYMLLQDIGSSRERYEGMLAWRKRKVGNLQCNRSVECE